MEMDISDTDSDTVIPADWKIKIFWNSGHAAYGSNRHMGRGNDFLPLF